MNDGIETKEEERGFKGIWIEKEIYLIKGMSWMEKILYKEIDSLNKKKGCFASNKYLADFLGTSESAISIAISKLKRLGLIRLESFDGRKRVLRSTPEGLKELKSRLLKFNRQGLENNKESNKDISIKIERRLSSKEDNYDFSAKSLSRPSIELLNKESPIKQSSIKRNHRRPSKDNPPEPDRPKGALVYGQASSEAQRLFEHWNGLSTTPVHKSNSKGVQKVLFLLDDKLISQYGEDEIKRAMDEFSEMQQNANLYLVTPQKVSIDTFFMNNGYVDSINRRKGREPELPWFQKLIVPNSYKNYLKRTDPNLEITEELKGQYQRHILHEEVAFSPKQESQFMQAGKKIKKYMEGHRLEEYIDGADMGDYVRMLFEAVEEEFGTVQIGNLCSNYTWNNMFPRFLSKYWEK